MTRINQTATVGSFIVRAFSILGTDRVVCDVFEPWAGHGTQATVDGVRMGRVGTRALPASIDALPARSAERLAAFDAWHAAQCAEAVAAIRQAFGQGGEADDRSGEVVTTAAAFLAARGLRGGAMRGFYSLYRDAARPHDLAVVYGPEGVERIFVVRGAHERPVPVATLEGLRPWAEAEASRDMAYRRAEARHGGDRL